MCDVFTPLPQEEDLEFINKLVSHHLKSVYGKTSFAMQIKSYLC